MYLLGFTDDFGLCMLLNDFVCDLRTLYVTFGLIM